MATEKFRRTWRGWTQSSEGYAVRLRGRSNLQYTDELGELHISAERMSEPPSEIVVYTASIPDTAERSRAEVLSRLCRALDHEGMSIVEERG